MKTTPLVALAVLLLSAALPSRAADPTVKGKVEQVWQALELPLRVPMLGILDIRMPAVPAKEGYLTVLRVQARLDNPANGGWNKFLGLEINGEKVFQSLNGRRDSPQRVLNRDLDWAPPGYEDDYMLFRDNCLNVVFAPDFRQFDARLEHEGEEAFWYVLDVTDRIRGQDGNALRLNSLAQPGWFNGEAHDIVIGDLSLGYLPASFRQAPQAALPRPLPAGQTLRGDGFVLMLTPEGGMAIQIGREHYLVETSLTWPRGERNWLACGDRLAREKPQEWQITRAELAATGGTVVATGRHYRLTRELKLDGPRLRVGDRIENLTGSELGMALSYDVSAGGPLPVLSLGGDSSPTVNYQDYAPYNPTLFAAQAASGLGWLAEDDVLRAQVRLRYDRGLVSASSTNFGLPPQGSYTLRWTLYPSTSTDYWDFVNQVRRDWEVNFTIDGPFRFIGHCEGLAKLSVEEMRKVIGAQHVRLAVMHPWTNYQYPYDREQHKAWWKAAQATLRQVDPTIRCLLMMEPPLESRVHQDAVEQDPYRDAMVVNPDGKVAFDMGYGPAYVGQKDFAAGWRLVWRYPTLDNSWLKYLEYDVRFAMEECAADGMYIDCFSYSGGRSWCRYTYDRWDGHTVDLDPKTHEITRKYADLGLLSAPAQQRVVELIQAKGGVVVANTEPATENMRRLRVNRFVETGGGARWDIGTHLYTPIALGLPGGSASATRSASAFIADVIENLKYGALYYYYSVPSGFNFGCIDRMFPFTPRELHSGWLVGEERIITTRSGEFGWGDQSGAEAYHYDAQGAESPLPVTPREVQGAKVYPLTVGPGEIVILVRQRP